MLGDDKHRSMSIFFVNLNLTKIEKNILSDYNCFKRKYWFLNSYKKYKINNYANMQIYVNGGKVTMLLKTKNHHVLKREKCAVVNYSKWFGTSNIESWTGEGRCGKIDGVAVLSRAMMKRPRAAKKIRLYEYMTHVCTRIYKQIRGVTGV